jgi:hypothetical protein
MMEAPAQNNNHLQDRIFEFPGLLELFLRAFLHIFVLRKLPLTIALFATVNEISPKKDFCVV